MGCFVKQSFLKFLFYKATQLIIERLYTTCFPLPRISNTILPSPGQNIGLFLQVVCRVNIDVSIREQCFLIKMDQSLPLFLHFRLFNS